MHKQKVHRNLSIPVDLLASCLLLSKLLDGIQAHPVEYPGRYLHRAASIFSKTAPPISAICSIRSARSG